LTARLDVLASHLGVPRHDIAVSWLEEHGAHPIIGARTPAEAELIGRPPVDLTEADLAALSE
jgi:hypothetical protein